VATATPYLGAEGNHHQKEKPHMRRVMAAVVVLAVACGGSERAGAKSPPQVQAEAATPAPAAAPAPMPRETGTVRDVQMLATPDGQFIFRPADLTIVAGDRVRWTNVSGGPHNVAFHPDRIPAGAKVLLNAAMKERMSDLTGKLLIVPNATYDISFAGLPPGRYEYYCTPHEMMGMRGTITVTR
jgi:plastocyanin